MGQKIDLTQQVQGILPEANGGVGPNAGMRFADAEVPSGIIDGVNTSYTLENAPNPPLSLLLFLQKVLQIQGIDYTLSGSALTMAVAPISGDTFLGWYRYRGFGQVGQFTDTMAMADAFVFDMPASALPLQPQDQMVMADDVVVLNIPTELDLAVSDQIVLSDGILKTLSPVMFEDLMLQKDQLILGYGDLIHDQLTLSDAFVKNLGSISPLTKALTDTNSVNWKDSLLKILSPTRFEFGETMILVDSMVKTLGINVPASQSLVQADVSDPFNATLTSVWTQIAGSLDYDGTTGLKVVTSITLSAISFSAMKRNDLFYGTQQKASVTVAAGSSFGPGILPMINIQAAGIFGYYGIFTGGSFGIRRADGNSTTALGSLFSGSVTVGDVLSLENDGAGNLTLKKNGTTLVSVTDTRYNEGSVGVASFGTSTARVTTFLGTPVNPQGMTENVSLNLV